MLETIIIICSVMLNIAALTAVYFLRADNRDLTYTVKFFVDKMNCLADITANNASKTKVSLALRYEDLQTSIAQIYADCIIYMKMKSKLTNNRKRYEQAPTEITGNSPKIFGSTGRDRGTKN